MKKILLGALIAIQPLMYSMDRYRTRCLMQANVPFVSGTIVTYPLEEQPLLDWPLSPNIIILDAAARQKHEQPILDNAAMCWNKFLEATMTENTTDLITLVTKNKINVNYRLQNSSFILFIALFSAKYKSAACLIQQLNANMSAMDLHNETILIALARNGKEEAVSFLLDQGIDAHHLNQGQRAKEAAQKAGHLAIVALLENHNTKQSAARAAEIN